jgi:membrane-bound metal-dependent hydrolase YbcI (DUF457 family)
MPNANVHVPMSAATGFAYALHQSRSQAPKHRLLESVAGALGGGFGGKVPDILDPPTSPSHRGHAHSLTLATVLLASRNGLAGAISLIRDFADEWDRRADDYEGGSPDGLICQLVAIVLRALAGFINGFYAGYLCHLGLDAMTPACVPLI